MRARKVKGLDPEAPFAANTRRIVEVRLNEVLSFADAARDPSAVTQLHDMRIAAKRLRYVLELATPVFGAAAKRGAKEARLLQDLLGEIHDCDESVPMVERHHARLVADDAADARDRAERAAEDLDPALLTEAPHRRRYRGLAVLDAHLRARRAFLYERFVHEWSRLERERFDERILTGIAAAPD